MAFIQRAQTVAKLARPLATAISGLHGKQGVQKAVFISQSNDIYTNLALEQWLGANMDCENLNVLLYYKNDPCVVLGKDGNPWLDVHHDGHTVIARKAIEAHLQYQDQGLMSFTFFGQDVQQSYNLGVISRAIFRKYGVSAASDGETLKFYDKQISTMGTKVECATNSYQNCSLFVDVNKENMMQTMVKDKITSTSNQMNVNEMIPLANTDSLLSAIGWEFMRTAPGRLQDGGLELARQQRGFSMVNPTDDWFPGLKKIRDNLIKWDWRYGSTPQFAIFRTFLVPADLLNNPSDSNELRVKLDVEQGKIADISLVVPPGLLSSGYTGQAQIITDIRGQKFSEETLKRIENFLGLEKCNNKREKFVTECVRKAMVI